jgi:hypothetical protein
MIALAASIGWGLLACGAITHVWHHRRLRELLAMHLDHERVPALVLTAVEVVLAIALPVAALTGHSSIRLLAALAFLLAVGFMIWISRLLLTGSDLPCACSFSSGPTSWWSFGRSCCVGLVGLFAFANLTAATPPLTTAEVLASLAVGWAVASAMFVLPEAIAWPATSRALMARVDAYADDAAPNTAGVGR